jgi:tRNA-specific 2-thiouridylase
MIRYRSVEHPATISPDPELPDAVRVEFDAPLRGITPGQAAVFYDGAQCLGGGIIS